jgi:hypothetical protein
MLRVFPLIPLILVAFTSPLKAGAPAPMPSPIERAFMAPVVIVGKVTKIEKDTVDAPRFIGVENKEPHKIAVVKIETNLAGAAGITHLRIGYIQPQKPDPKTERPWRVDPTAIDPKEGDEILFFLVKNPKAPFHTIPILAPPVEAKSAEYKATVEGVTRALVVIADPAKALKTEKADDRFRAAVTLILRYTSVSHGTGEAEAVPIGAEENRVILNALAEGDWKLDPAGASPNPFIALYRLGLGEAEGWKQPLAKPGEEYSETTRKAFAAWLKGPGKDYRIKKYVSKKK